MLFNEAKLANSKKCGLFVARFHWNSYCISASYVFHDCRISSIGNMPLVQEEPATVAWFGIRLGPSTFGIFDVFPDEAGRQAHLTGKVAAALIEKAPELSEQPPSIEKIDILADKLPH